MSTVVVIGGVGTPLAQVGIGAGFPMSGISPKYVPARPATVKGYIPMGIPYKNGVVGAVPPLPGGSGGGGGASTVGYGI